MGHLRAVSAWLNAESTKWKQSTLLLEAAGLELAARFGDIVRNPLTGESPNQICIARRRGEG